MVKGEGVVLSPNSSTGGTMRRIHPSGPLNAPLAIIGEAGGVQEEREGIPFRGAAGNKLKLYLNEVGLTLGEVYLDNVYPYRPRGNDINTVSPEEIHHEWIPKLRQRLNQLTNVKVIVPVGNYACYALTGKGTVKGVGRRSTEDNVGITKLRGSVYTHYCNSRPVKVIPTIHPAAILRRAKWEKRTLTDWGFIKEEMAGEVDYARRRQYYLDPTNLELSQLWDRIVDGEVSHLSIDIETWGRTLSCVGFGVSKEEAYVLPTLSREEKEYYLEWVRRLCESDTLKILQNGLYDLYWLEEYGISVNNYVFDTLSMHHAIDPAEEHSLAFLASIYTSPRQNFWKDEAKDAEEKMKYANDREALHTYNAIDVCVTYEVFENLYDILINTGRFAFYLNHYQKMYEPLLRCMRGGIRCDIERQREWADILIRECDVIREKLKGMAGEELYATEEKTTLRIPEDEEWEMLLIELHLEGEKKFKPKNIDRGAMKELGYVMSKRMIKEKEVLLKKSFSGVKLRRFFFDTLKVPKKYKMVKGEDGKRRTDTLDKAALLEIAIQVPKASEAAKLLIEHRRKSKVAQFLQAKKDKDGRIRCTYKQNTEAGRLASAKNPMGGGANLQNQDREIRDTYLPDEGTVWLAVDGSSVEDRIVKMLTGSARLQEMANLRPTQFDAHSYNASLLYGRDEITKKMRQDSKFVAHGGQRNMGAPTLARKFLMDTGEVKTPSECKRLMEVYLSAHEEIRSEYWPWVRRNLLRDRMRLANGWGRLVDFGTERMDDELYRRGYSWYPQSECVDWLNQTGWVPLFYYLRDNKMKSRLMTHEHDGFGVSAYVDEIWDIVMFLINHMECVRVHRGGELVIPVSITVGRSWAGDKDGGREWDGLPNKGELEDFTNEILSNTTNN